MRLRRFPVVVPAAAVLVPLMAVAGACGRGVADDVGPGAAAGGAHAIDSAGPSPAADLDAAFAALDAGDVAGARRILAEGPAPGDGRLRHRFLAARCDLDDHAWDAAADAFLTLRRDAPAFEPAWTANNAGVALAAAGRHAAAVLLFDEALARPAADRAPRMYVNVVQSLIALDRTEEALRRVDEGIGRFQDDPFLWDNRAWCLSLLGRNAERDAAARRAGELADASLPPRAPIELISPVAGRVRVVQAPGGTYSHHLLSNRWAWDLQPVIGTDPFHGTGTRNGDYAAFGAPVRAVADGRVVFVVDGVEDSPPGRPDPRSPSGNRVFLEHAGFYSSVLHLKCGSVTVRRGDRVKAGDVIAAVGNSGWSTSPHVCFSLSATPSPGEISIPCRFRDVEGLREQGATWICR